MNQKILITVELGLYSMSDRYMYYQLKEQAKVKLTVAEGQLAVNLSVAIFTNVSMTSIPYTVVH